MRRKLTGAILRGGILAFLLALVVPAEAGAASLPRNLLRNGGFEQCKGCVSGGGGIPVAWSAVGDASGVTWTTDAKLAGAASVLISDGSDSTAAGVESEPLDVNPGGSYAAEVWAIATENSTATSVGAIAIQFFDPSGQRIGGVTRQWLLRSTWSPQTIRATAPVGAATVNVAVFSPDGSTGEYYADRASLLIDVPVIR